MDLPMSHDVPRYQARPEIFRSFALRQELHRLVEASPGFLEVYEQLLQWLGGSWREFFVVPTSWERKSLELLDGFMVDMWNYFMGVF